MGSHLFRHVWPVWQVVDNLKLPSLSRSIPVKIFPNQPDGNDDIARCISYSMNTFGQTAIDWWPPMDIPPIRSTLTNSAQQIPLNKNKRSTGWLTRSWKLGNAVLNQVCKFRHRNRQHFHVILKIWKLILWGNYGSFFFFTFVAH